MFSPRQRSKHPITLFDTIVHENDRVDKTREGAARYAGRKGLRTCQQRCLLLCFYLKHNPDGPILSLAEIFSHAASEDTGKRKLFVVISSDKGLCGGIHSSVSKATRREFAEKDKVEADSPIMVIGDKSKAQLSRALPKNLALTFNQIGRDIPTFADAAGVADLILTSGAKYDTIAIVYNRFVSAISYEPTIVEIEPETLLKESGKLLIEDVEWILAHSTSAGFRAYEMEDDVTKDLSEFTLANAIYAALVEGHACEQSAR